MKNYLTFDVGTTAMKCILFDKDFKELFYINKEYSINAEREGFAELSANTYFLTFCKCIEDMQKAGIAIKDIGSVTFTTQGETLIPVDQNGAALCPAIVWLDTRASEEADYIKSQIEKQCMYSKTGLCDIDGALPAAKILWLSKNQPSIYNNTYKFLLLEDYLIYKLTGKFVSEKSLQSSTGWYDIKDDTLFDDMLNICSIPKNKLPEILPCGTVVGNVNKELCEQLGFSYDTVVITGAMDQISSAVAIGNIKEGIFTETTGTALVAGITTANPVFDLDNPVTVYKHFDDKFIYMPYYNTAGMALKWFKDKLMPYAEEEGRKEGLSAYAYIDKAAEKAPCGSGGVVMLPHLSEEGAFIGITLATSVCDMARSVLEGVAYMLRGITELIESRGITIDKIYSLGGGSYSPLWCSIKSDVCKKSIICIEYPQTTALGAAIIASVAMGDYNNVEDAIAKCNIKGNEINPDENNFTAYDKGYKKYKKYLLNMEG